MKARTRAIELAGYRRGPVRFDEPIGINVSWWLVALCCSLMLWGAIIAGAMNLAELLR